MITILYNESYVIDMYLKKLRIIPELYQIKIMIISIKSHDDFLVFSIYFLGDFVES